jgi:hypothetical protein
VNERPAGYVLSHPWSLGTLPRLNSLLGELPAVADTYARRVGAATYITNALTKHARAHGFPTMSLVAVNGSLGFWQRHEFEEADIPELFPKLLSYEPEARLMVRRL